MIKYAKIINEQTGLCEVGLGTNTGFYKSIGMTGLDVQQSDIDGNWYLVEKCPMKTDEEKLEDCRRKKHEENLKKAYLAEDNGIIQYKGVLFETTSANISKLTSQFAMIQAGLADKVLWLSKNDIQVELKIEDIIELGQLITEYTSNIWNTKYLGYKSQIAEASGIDTLETINITY